MRHLRELVLRLIRQEVSYQEDQCARFRLERRRGHADVGGEQAAARCLQTATDALKWFSDISRDAA